MIIAHNDAYKDEPMPPTVEHAWPPKRLMSAIASNGDEHWKHRVSDDLPAFQRTKQKISTMSQYRDKAPSRSRFALRTRRLVKWSTSSLAS
jgi:hypothetical protein